MYWNGHDMNGWDWFAMSVGTVLLWTLLIAVAVLVFRALTRVPDPSYPDASRSRATAVPERLLAERFARGEIDEEEYRRRLAVLRAEDAGLGTP